MFGGEYGGPNLAFNYSIFLDLWEYSYYWGLLTCPWTITLDYPADIHREEIFTVTATVMYPCPSPFSPSDYPTSSVNVAIKLPSSLSLVLGENATKSIGNMPAGQSATTSWSVKGESFGNKTVVVEVEGRVVGSAHTLHNRSSWSHPRRICY